MKLCPACRRHLRSPEDLCPFCGAEQRSEADRSGSSLMAGALLSALLVACSEQPTASGSSSSSSSGVGTDGGSTTGSVVPTTGGPGPNTDVSGGSTQPGPTTDGSGTSTGPGLDTGDEGCAFYAGCPPDVGPEHVIACDVFAQDCAAGQKCVAWGSDSWTGAKCVPVTGDKGPGEPCTAPEGPFAGIDDCALGAMCWSVDERSNEGTCFSMCGGVPGEPACPGDSGCGTISDVLNLCFPACDPLVQDCAEGDVCVQVQGKFVCVIDASGTMGVINDTCEFVNGCDEGLACVDLESASSECKQGGFGCCQPFCDVTMPADCPNADQECVVWFDPMEEEVPPGFEDVGVCAIPP